MRGTLSCFLPVRCRAGIIPAYAGNTTAVLIWPSRWRDHPRVCGEHSGALVQAQCRAGSSPRMRGTRVWTCREYWFAGIIPAYAGNTKPTVGIVPAKRDHPRVCGEHLGKPFELVGWQGSSPRMRGTRGACNVDVTARGIIPAYAGNTLLMELALNRFRDHPRVCGEHSFTDIEDMGYTGSSPRMRGTPSPNLLL